MIATVHATEKGRHGGITNDTSRYIHEQEYWLTYEAWRIIVCSQFMKGEVVSSFNAPPDKVDVIYNGVNAEKFEFEWIVNPSAMALSAICIVAVGVVSGLAPAWKAERLSVVEALKSE